MPLNPLCGATVIVSVTDPDSETVRELEPELTPTASPVPFSVTDCGEPETLSVMVRAPVRAPPAVGMNVTEMVQLPTAANALPQLLVSAKSPDAAMDEMLSVDPPVLESTTGCATLVEPVGAVAKVRLAGATVTVGGGSVAVPLRPIVCGEPVALLAMVTEPVRLPVTVGANVTLSWQLEFGPIATPQALDTAKPVDAVTEWMVIG